MYVLPLTLVGDQLASAIMVLASSRDPFGVFATLAAALHFLSQNDCLLEAAAFVQLCFLVGLGLSLPAVLLCAF